MASKTIYNLEALISVKIADKKKCDFLTYKPELKFIIVLRRAGFWSDTHRYSKEHLEKKGFYSNAPMLIEDNVTYYKPYVTLKFAGEQQLTKHFNSFEEANTWGQEQIKAGMYFKLEIEN